MFSLSKKIIRAVGGTAICLIIINKLINRCLKKRLSSLQRELQIDHLNVNKMIVFLQGNNCVAQIHTKCNCNYLSCNFSRLNYLLDLVNRAKISLDVCIYNVNFRVIVEEIIKAHRRNVKVRIICDYGMSQNSPAINDFIMQGIEVRRQFSQYFMHHKFIIVDAVLLINGSMNFTVTAVVSNVEHVLVTTNPKLVNDFSKTFEHIWEDFSAGSKLPKFKKIT